ncbi:TonB-dependent siderophore receptor [Pusillimonas sp. TS35]|nr:TonB-dependent siderophore receptor [Pusillimonas sp. TS35]
MSVRARPLFFLIHTAVFFAAIGGSVRAQERSTLVQPVELSTITVRRASEPGLTETSRAYTTDIMDTATGLPLSIRDTPQSVSVVTRQMMDDRGMQTTADALQSAPSVSVTRSDTNRYAFSARGFSIDNYQFDGWTQPVLSPWAFGESNLDLAVFDRVEIVRGATGLMTGAGNPSAAVNYVRKRPLRGFAASAGIDAGSWDFVRGFADISTLITQDGRIRGRLIGAYAKANSYTELQDSTARTLYGVITADLAVGTVLTGGVVYQSTANDGFGSGFPLFYSDGVRTDFKRSISNNASWSRIANDTTAGFLDLTHHFANAWKLRLTYNQSVTDAVLKQIFRGGYPDRHTGLGTANSFAYYKGDVHRKGLNLSFSGPFSLFGREHSFTVGWMRAEDRLSLPRYRALAPVPDAGSFYNPGATPEPNWSQMPSQADDLDNTQSGGYAVGRFTVIDNLQLIVGGRISTWETDQTFFGAKRQYRHKHEFVPYAGLVFDLNDTYTAYASYTEIFKPQHARNEHATILPPISGKSYELGIKAAWFGGRLNSAASLFQTRQDNLAEATGNNVIGAPPNTPAYRAVSGAKVEGVEVEMGGELSPGWNVASSFTTFVAKDTKRNPINTHKPRSLFKLYSTYRFRGDFNRLTIGGGVDWQNRMYQTATAPGNRTVQVEQGSYAIVNLMARYEFNKRLTATLNVNNLFDKKYYAQIGFYNQGWYGAPRNVMLALRAQY